MGRIAETFALLKAAKRGALMPYLMVGYPEKNSLDLLAPALQAAGADLFEIGVPFSDPLADGATIQRASEQALRNGVNVQFSLDAVARLRANGVQIPLVMMGYYNPFLQYGVERFAHSAAQAGADGVIIPDLPPEEAGPMQIALRANGLDLIMFIAPTTPDILIAQIAAVASGFIYCVSLTGVTGARTSLWDGLPAFLDRVRTQTSLPLVVGFGISTPEHVRNVATCADGAIVASAIINVLYPRNAPCLTVGVWYNLSIKSFVQQGSVVVPTNHIDAFAG
ncbi:MAG: tryptophan synthase subunit alpha [Chloroflexales bacterium]|nr:tryptophan synthase subunit alpha [Chloroflexales bacterium]